MRTVIQRNLVASTGYGRSLQEVAINQQRNSVELDRKGEHAFNQKADAYHDPSSGSDSDKPCLQNSPSRDSSDLRTVHPRILEHNCPTKETIPHEFLPQGFPKRVFLRSLDLIDRCNHSTLLILGKPCAMDNEKVLGDHKWPELQKKWSARSVTVFDDLSDEDLADFGKDGAVVIDCGGGKIHEVTVELHTLCSDRYVVTGGVRTSQAFRMTQTPNIDVVTICKKLKRDSPDEDALQGYVSLFSSDSTRRDPPEFYRYKYGGESLQARMDDEGCRKLSHHVVHRDPIKLSELSEYPMGDGQSLQSPQFQLKSRTHSDTLDAATMTPCGKDAQTPSTVASSPTIARKSSFGSFGQTTPISRHRLSEDTPMSARSPEPGRDSHALPPVPLFPD